MGARFAECSDASRNRCNFQLAVHLAQVSGHVREIAELARAGVLTS